MLLALLLQAATPPGPPQPPATMMVEPVAALLVSFDTNVDGRTTRAEMYTGVVQTFAAIEQRPATPLGYIGYSDWAERWLGDRNALPSPFEVDADGDNKITLAELQAALARVFDRLDRNKDGALTRPEALTIRAMTGDRFGPGRNGRRDAPPR